jgi:hypothetical protein
MFKKLCVAFLSVCIAVAMILGVNIRCTSDNDHDNVILCILEVERESY